MTRHKCFVSFHRADHASVVAFKRHFDDVQDTFIFRGQEMPEDIIRSNDDDYVMGRIRERFLKDSTVTIVLVGACTWARKFVDWEVQASLRRPSSDRAGPDASEQSCSTTTRARRPQRGVWVREIPLVPVEPDRPRPLDRRRLPRAHRIVEPQEEPARSQGDRRPLPIHGEAASPVPGLTTATSNASSSPRMAGEALVHDVAEDQRSRQSAARRDNERSGDHVRRAFSARTDRQTRSASRRHQATRIQAKCLLAERAPSARDGYRRSATGRRTIAAAAM
jgi:hypothetical protein